MNEALGSTGDESVGILMYQSMSALLYPGQSTTSASLGIEHFQPSCTFRWVMFSPPALVPLDLSILLAEHVKGQFRLLILVAPCWMEASWLPTVLNKLVDIPHYCPIIKKLDVDVWWTGYSRVCHQCI